MGGGVGSKLMRPFRSWNAESRAHKIISRDKPIPAPMYEATKKQIKLVDELDPEYKKEAMTKDSQLDDHLKKVYVTSNSAEVQEIDSRSDPNRPLPLDRYNFEGFEYGFYEPTEVKPGRVTLRQALTFINKHNEDPDNYTPYVIAEEYKLEPKTVSNILEYYRVFKVTEKKEGSSGDSVAQPMQLSLRSGIRIQHTVKKKMEIKKTLMEMLDGPEFDAEEKEEEKAIEKKKLQEREKVKQIQKEKAIEKKNLQEREKVKKIQKE